MEDETEMMMVRPIRDCCVQAATVIDTFYEDLRVATNPGRNAARMASSPSQAARNRENMYQDSKQRASAAAASRRHLGRHPEWLSGSSALGAKELRALVALQHFASVDVQDLSLPPSERCSDDDFTDEGISRQLQLDAGRSDFVLLDRELSFKQELELRGASLEQDSLEVERLLREFELRLERAFLDCFTERSSPLLIQAISQTMSQSGMANVEQACAGPHIVVSGGEQTLRYELTSLSPDTWEVSSLLRKYDFQQFVLCDEVNTDDPSKVHVMECSAKSQILRSCTLRFEIDDNGGLCVDARSLVDRFEMFDTSGKRLQIPGLAPRQKSQWKELVNRMVDFRQRLRPHRSWLDFVGKVATRCIACRRRACARVEAIPSRLKFRSRPRLRMVTGTEDADESIRAPLRDMLV